MWLNFKTKLLIIAYLIVFFSLDDPLPVTTIILAVVLGSYGLCNIIAMIVFLAYYNRKSNSVSDAKDTVIFKNKERLNARFPWLQRMLPCINVSAGKLMRMKAIAQIISSTLI